MKRIGFVMLLAGFVIGSLLSMQSAQAQNSSQVPERLIKTFLHITVYPGVKTPGSDGDIWANTWADDDAMYAACCDTKMFNGRNCALCRIGGTPEKPVIEPLNPMEQLKEFMAYHGTEGSWKASGMLCVKGRLYMALFHHRYVTETKQWPWWTATDATIISSGDHGATWTQVPDKAMFPGKSFGNPSFVQYGKNYSLAPDNYVYAVSAGDGRWTNNDHYYLGRVPIDSIENREAWSFFSGREGNSPQWDSLEKAKPIVTAPRSLGCAPDIVWLPGEKAHMMVTFSVPGMPDDTDAAVGDDAVKAHQERTLFHVYVAENVWGPWRLVYSGEGPGPVDYSPRIPVKWLPPSGEAWLFSAGNFMRLPYLADHYAHVVSKMTWGNKKDEKK